ncbi:LPS export ABC transporter permease LptF [Candidatus Thioglobus sp. NP1]|uniref:LPS export ABC transporter permease LptF n=1 Tax=Candidatus Thioglobus sp. NP1 TaxID=2508687 RepID=UPI000DED9C5E|nr:LPS export ABC transporter permease LptF [Candidatus Thioglobus sp. NP1]AXE62293.1 LPS export ABC transporter permease LptF [Candidatus Thioglobus sp. NP1]
MLHKIFNFQNTLISKYLIRNLIIFFFGITFIIALIVFGNQYVLTVQESVQHGIPIQELMPLVGLNMLRDIPIILTLSLFLSIIISISQLYKNSEAVVMNSIGIGDKNFISLIQPIIVFSFVIVLILSIFAVPWAKQQKSIEEDKTINASEFSFISEGKFESFKNGDIVFYASESENINAANEQNMEEIFIYAIDNENTIIVLASKATKYVDNISKSIYLRLKDGVRYQGLPGSDNINILEFELYDLEIVSGEVQKSISDFSEIEEKSTLELIKEGGPLANAEVQWRFSQPISVLILSILGVYLGRSSPRTGKGINILIGLVFFMLYNNGLLIAKTSIENNELNPFIGLWSIHILLAIFLIIFSQFREGKVLPIIDKITTFNNKDKGHV